VIATIETVPPPTPVEIHQATLADLPEVRTVRLRALKDAPNAFASSYERESRFTDDVWTQRLTSGSATFIAQTNGSTIGICTGLPSDNGAVELVGMWVDPAARGSGVGWQLGQTLVTWAAAQGADRVHLWVTGTNARATRFYTKLGFTLTGEQQPLPSDPGVPEFGMVRPISPVSGAAGDQ
jgi:ribosomal protein S18 acetylase RimI-like enzyme